MAATKSAPDRRDGVGHYVLRQESHIKHRNNTVLSYFAEDGVLSQKLPGFHPRPQQQAAAMAIADTMAAPGALALIEASTGVGKTLAYLIPALKMATPKRKVVISTHSLALQAQLIERDIPFVQGLAGSGLRAAVLKGRGNYLCRQDFEAARTELWSVGDPQFQKIREWSTTSPTGDVAELPFSYPGWIDIRANSDTCKGKECRYFDTCFYYNARKQAQDASIIIVNHALFFSDLAMRHLEEEATILPDYAFVVFDEAHHLEAAAAGAFGIACSSSRISSLTEKLRRLGRQVDLNRDRLKAMDATNDALFGPLGALGRSEFTLDAALSGFDVGAARSLVAELGAHLQGAATDLLKVDHGGNPTVKDRIDGLRRICARTREELTLIFTGEDPNFLRWGSVNRQTRRGTTVTVNWTPISVAPILARALWHPPRPAGAALISATLATDGNFEFLRQRLGIGLELPDEFPDEDEDSGDETYFDDDPPPWDDADPSTWMDARNEGVKASSPSRRGRGGEERAEVEFNPGRENLPECPDETGNVFDPNADISELVVGSPFDYAGQALLYMPARIPAPGDDPGYAYALVSEILGLLAAARGGAFLLFTSYRILNLAAEKLVEAELPFPILRQGEMPNARLVEAFRAKPDAVLLGTQSFWEGVDIPGESLRLVVIDKLPFTTPENPLHQARVKQITAAGGDWFGDYALPQAQLKLKQGFGRLIRTATDRGVVALMDARVRTKSYGRRILASLPPARVTTSLDEVRAFYQGEDVTEMREP
ncbi:MAG: ATP-dependent DNA helicase [Capsulimonadaceae bacterium]